jgi:hypothetical protein
MALQNSLYCEHKGFGRVLGAPFFPALEGLSGESTSRRLPGFCSTLLRLEVPSRGSITIGSMGDASPAAVGRAARGNWHNCCVDKIGAAKAEQSEARLPR